MKTTMMSSTWFMTSAQGGGLFRFDHPPAEQIDRQADASVLDALGTSRANPGDHEMAQCVAIHIDAALLENEQVVHLKIVALHAGDLADADDFSASTGQATGLNHDLDRAGDLMPQARIGMSYPAIAIMTSSRARASRVVLAWTVVIEPSWPVFIAWSMSSASPDRTSPMMIRSGRIRRQFLTRSRWVTSPLPSMLAGRVSRRTTCGC